MLQWGRRQTSTERVNAAVITAAFGQLQWGRRQTSTERRARPAPTIIPAPLQWGRRQTSTERGKQPRALRTAKFGFNGAADKRRRRDELVAHSGERVP